jgi:ApaG protein
MITTHVRPSETPDEHAFGDRRVSTPEMSEITTDGIRVGATAFFLEQESDRSRHHYVFGYRIVILNEGDAPAKLISRRWMIVDADGQRQDVEGPGVVGQTPLLAPGQAFKYTSFCPLTTPWGTMEGSYLMERTDGTRFNARIARFYLALPAQSTAPAVR